MFLKLNEVETRRIVRVNADKIIFYKTVILRNTSQDRDGYDAVTATGIRFENDPIMLVVNETVDEIDDLLVKSYHYVK